MVRVLELLFCSFSAYNYSFRLQCSELQLFWLFYRMMGAFRWKESFNHKCLISIKYTTKYDVWNYKLNIIIHKNFSIIYSIKSKKDWLVFDSIHQVWSELLNTLCQWIDEFVKRRLQEKLQIAKKPKSYNRFVMSRLLVHKNGILWWSRIANVTSSLTIDTCGLRNAKVWTCTYGKIRTMKSRT